METEIADSAGGSEGHDPAQEPVLASIVIVKDGKEHGMDAKDGNDNEMAKDGKEHGMDDAKDGKQNHEMEAKDGKQNHEMDAKDGNP